MRSRTSPFLWSTQKQGFFIGGKIMSGIVICSVCKKEKTAEQPAQQEQSSGDAWLNEDQQQ